MSLTISFANYQTAPTTLGALNDRLVKCIEEGNLSPLELVEGSAPLKKVSFSLFFKALEELITSYPDRHCTEKVLLLQKLVMSIYPVTKDNKDVYKIFTLVINRMKNPSLALPNPDSSSFPCCINPQTSYVPVLVEYFFSTSRVKEVLNSAYVKKPPSPEKRLARILSTPALDAKAYALQHALSLVLLERKLIELVYGEDQAIQKTIEANKIYTEGSSYSVRLGMDKQVSIFTVPEEALDSEAFAFYLQYQSLHQMCESCFQHVFSEKKLTLDNFIPFYQKLLELQQFSTAPQADKGIKRMFSFLETSICTLYKTQSSLQTFKIYNSLDADANFYYYFKEHGQQLTPFLYLFISYLERYYSTLSLWYLQRIPSAEADYFKDYYLSSIREAIVAYEKFAPTQEALYSYGIRQLSSWQFKSSHHASLEQRQTKGPIHTFIRKLPGTFSSFALTEFNPFDELLKAYHLEHPAPLPEISSPPRSLSISSSSNQSTNSSSNTSFSPSSLTDDTLSTTSVDFSPPTNSPLLSSVILSSFSPSPPVPFSYSKRVKRWLDCSLEGPLDPVEFKEYASLPPNKELQTKLFHGFSLSVDSYYTIGMETTWRNPTTKRDDKQYIIPAEFAFKNSTIRGVITYCIDTETQICYHRYFKRIDDKNLIEKCLSNAFMEADFPELKDALSYKEEAVSPFTKNNVYLSKDVITFHPLFGTITIEDRKFNTTIKLFKVTSSF